MEHRFSVSILMFNDLKELDRAVESIPEDVPIHVFDGRYQDFDADHSLTPGASEYCRSRHNLRYHAPPDSLLPFGNPDVGKSYRDSVHQKACWAYYEILDQDQWTIHMDTDERLVYLDRDFFDRIQDDVIYSPRMYMRDDLSGDSSTTISCTMRIFKPKFWTFWVDDLPIPRHQCKRGLGAKETKKIHQEMDQWQFRRRTQAVIIENLGAKRDGEYLMKRKEQLTKFHE